MQYDKEITKFLEDNEDLLRQDDMIGLYEEWAFNFTSYIKERDTTLICLLTEYFLENGVNPLDYTNGVVPAHYARFFKNEINAPKVDISKYMVRSSAFLHCKNFIECSGPIKSTAPWSYEGSDISGDITIDCDIAIGSFKKVHLDSVTIGNKCMSIDEFAFSGATIGDIYIPDSVFSIQNNSFADLDKSTTIHLSHSLDEKRHIRDNTFANIEYTD